MAEPNLFKGQVKNLFKGQVKNNDTETAAKNIREMVTQLFQTIAAMSRPPP
jgi:molybdopterin-binding protein